MRETGRRLDTDLRLRDGLLKDSSGELDRGVIGVIARVAGIVAGDVDLGLSKYAFISVAGEFGVDWMTNESDLAFVVKRNV